MNGSNPTTRRALLGWVATGSAAALSGCNDTGGSTPTPTATEVATPDDWRNRVAFEDVDREVYVEARRFSFSPGTDEPIRVGSNERVGVALRSMDGGYNDGGHGISLPACGVEMRAPPSVVATTTLVADEEGEFDFQCNVYCGGGHDEMKGVLIVEP